MWGYSNEPIFAYSVIKPMGTFYPYFENQVLILGKTYTIEKWQENMKMSLHCEFKLANNVFHADFKSKIKFWVNLIVYFMFN